MARETPKISCSLYPHLSSWINQMERWFAEITNKRIRRGTFRSVRDLIKTINDYIRHYNKNPRPFQWVASASQIIRKVRKYKETSDTADWQGLRDALAMLFGCGICCLAKCRRR